LDAVLGIACKADDGVAKRSAGDRGGSGSGHGGWLAVDEKDEGR
jgi:hypothetical protein